LKNIEEKIAKNSGNLFLFKLNVKVKAAFLIISFVPIKKKLERQLSISTL